MNKTIYQIMVGGEPLTWANDVTCWPSLAETLPVLAELQDYTNPRDIRVWRVWQHDTHGHYSAPQITDETCDAAALIADARMALDGHCVEPSTLTWPEKFFGSFAAFHADDYCEELARGALNERADAALVA